MSFAASAESQLTVGAGAYCGARLPVQKDADCKTGNDNKVWTYSFTFVGLGVLLSFSVLELSKFQGKLPIPLNQSKPSSIQYPRINEHSKESP